MNWKDVEIIIFCLLDYVLYRLIGRFIILEEVEKVVVWYIVNKDFIIVDRIR